MGGCIDFELGGNVNVDMACCLHNTNIKLHIIYVEIAKCSNF